MFRHGRRWKCLSRCQDANLINIKQAAREFGKSPHTIRDMVRTGELPKSFAIKRTRGKWFYYEELERVFRPRPHQLQEMIA